MSSYGTFTMTGGEISGNTATNSVEYGGGGVYVSSGTFTLGGTAKILGNADNSGKASNVYINFYMGDDLYITLGTGENAPASGMEVGVRTATASGVIVNSDAKSGDEQYFFSDDSSFVKYDGGKLMLVPDDPTPIFPNRENRIIGAIGVQTKGNQIILQNLPPNAKVEVYNLQGKQVYSTTSHFPLATPLKIEVQTKGMYIIKVNSQTLRVAVR